MARSAAERQVRLSVCKGVADKFDELQAMIRHGGDLGRLMGDMASSVMSALFHPETRWAVREYYDQLEEADGRAGGAVTGSHSVQLPPTESARSPAREDQSDG